MKCGMCNQEFERPNIHGCCPHCGKDPNTAGEANRTLVQTKPKPDVATGGTLEEPKETIDQRTGVKPYWPRGRRIKLARICLLDDGELTEGEYIRVREEKVVIGREEGQIRIPNDPSISKVHAELCWETKDNQARWVFRNRSETTGTFLRLKPKQDYVLRNEKRLLMGSLQFRYVAEWNGDGASCHSPTLPLPPRPDATIFLRTEPPRSATEAVFGALVRIAQGKEDQPFGLQGASIKIGTKSNQASFLQFDDPWMDPFHAALTRDINRRWCIKDLQSVNGTWIEIDEADIWGDEEFQIGEQRIQIKVFDYVDSIGSSKR